MYKFSIGLFYWPAAFAAICCSLLGFIFLRRSNIKAIMLLFVFTMMIVLNLGWSGAQYLSQKSVKPLTNVVKPLLHKYPSSIVANYGDYFYDSQFYLNRLTLIVDHKGELATTSMMPKSGASRTLWSAEKFWPVWNSSKRVFVFVSKDNYNAIFVTGKEDGIVLAKTPKRYLLTNIPIH